MSLMMSRRYKNGVGQEPYEGHPDVTVDLIVVGLGTAGSIATVTAARNGLKVLAIEQLTGMGGTGTLGGVRIYYLGQRGGVYEELDKYIHELEKSARDYTPQSSINGEIKQKYLEQVAVEYGVDLHYESTVTGVLLEGKRVRGIEWLEAGELKSAEAQIVLDCTGDAYVCAMAGCELRGGREVDGQNQPFSNVINYLESGRVKFLNKDAGYVDAYDSTSVSKAIIESSILVTHLREKYEANQRLLNITPILGVRESRFIVGEEEVSWHAFIEDRVSVEPIFYAYSNLDNHSKDIAFESESQQDWSVASSLWGLHFHVPIPLGALIPKGYDGLMAAGRCIDLDHDIASCVRMQRDMQKCGEAAAIAAEMAIRNDVAVKEINLSKLRERLFQSHCLTIPNTVTENEGNAQSTMQWLTDIQEIKKGLESTKPGIAIWSAKRMGKKIHQELLDWSRSRSEHLRKHSAISLALMGDSSASEILLEMVRERDPFVPHTSTNYNMVRGFAAIYLLGRLREHSAIPALGEVLNDPEVGKLGLRKDEFLVDHNELRFQYVSFSLAALGKIGDGNDCERPAIAKILNEWLESNRETFIITLKPTTEIKYDMTHKLRGWTRDKLRQWE